MNLNNLTEMVKMTGTSTSYGIYLTLDENNSFNGHFIGSEVVFDEIVNNLKKQGTPTYEAAIKFNDGTVVTETYAELKKRLFPATKQVVTDENYIEAYNKLGCEYFAKGNDKQLKEWGNSDDKIRQIKIDCVKGHLEWHKDGINTYKYLNEICGGKNVL